MPPMLLASRRGVVFLGLAVGLGALVASWLAWIVWEPAGIGGGDLIWSTAWALFAVLGAVIAPRGAGARVGALFLLAGDLALVATLLDVVSAHLIGSGSALAFAAWLRWAQNLAYLPALVLAVPLALLRFPDGALVSRRFRYAEVALIAAVAVVTFADAVEPGAIGDALSVENPAGWAAGSDVASVPGAIARPLLALGLAAAAVSAVVRWRRAAELERRQLLWLMWGAGAAASALAALVALGLAGANAGDTAMALVGAAIVAILPLSVTVAIAREGLYDIELLIRRSVVLLVTAGAIALAYIAVVVAAGALTRSGGTATTLLATVVGALVALPVRSLATRAIDRRLFGHRSEPYRALRELGAHARRAPDAAQALQAMAESTIGALRLPGVVVEDGEGRVLAAAGRLPGTGAEHVPLVHQGRAVGVLLAGRRSPAEQLSRAERELLGEIAGPIAAGVGAVMLTGDVQRARERLVLASEEERRRLRRDLHDGIGPTLAAMSLHLGLARDGAPPAAAARLDEVARLLDQASGDLRRAVQGLRPAALDDLGLVGALREQIASLGDHLDASLTVGELGEVPAAVEAAVYRIVIEALTNVVRHSHASSLRVTLASELVAQRPGVRATVWDDGIGVGDARPGVGRRSMAERAEELGGSIVVAPAGERGTVVNAWLPA
jgi:signal transduction histidine kinase